MDSKRVLFVSSLRRFGGGERWMLDTASGLRARGHDVRLVAAPGSVLAARAPARGIPLTEIPIRGDVDAIAVAQLTALVRRNQPHVVVPILEREIRLCAAAIRAARALGPRRLRPRLVPRRGSEFPLKDKRRYRLVYALEVERVIVNSEATRRNMMRDAPWFPESKAVVVYNGIDAEPYLAAAARRDELRARLRSTIGVPGDAPVFTLVGELHERKQHRVIIEAWPHVLERFPGAVALFVGDGADREQLEGVIAARGLGESIRLLGFHSDVADILAGSDALLLPSRVEGFGYVLVEAMAVGIPCIASNVSSIPEIVRDGETGILHPVGDTGAIVAAIDRVLSDPAGAAAMGQAGSRVALDTFTLSHMLDQVEHVLFD
ncbi:MAG TPA: glycosyltransferase family 4 protein [Candidatus Krumholzibacteria bacterium]|nr:glycosyltransferase family 4 protein [Candidatus Krumholzibacteria bacterium]